MRGDFISEFHQIKKDVNELQKKTQKYLYSKEEFHSSSYVFRTPKVMSIKSGILTTEDL